LSEASFATCWPRFRCSTVSSDELLAIFSAMRNTSALSSALGKSSLTMPSRCASWAVIGSPVMGEGEPIEQAAAIMMEAHWRSVVHPDRVEGSRAFYEGREPTFQDPDY